MKPWRHLHPVDLGAGLALLLAAAGLVWSPKLATGLATASGQLKPIELIVDVKQVPVDDPEALMADMREEGTTRLVVRNQPAGALTVHDVLLRQRLVTLADGTTMVDPNLVSFPHFEARLVLRGMGQETATGFAVGSTNLKIGAPVELEGRLYRIKGAVSGLTTGNTPGEA